MHICTCYTLFESLHDEKPAYFGPTKSRLELGRSLRRTRAS